MPVHRPGELRSQARTPVVCLPRHDHEENSIIYVEFNAQPSILSDEQPVEIKCQICRLVDVFLLKKRIVSIRTGK